MLIGGRVEGAELVRGVQSKVEAMSRKRLGYRDRCSWWLSFAFGFYALNMVIEIVERFRCIVSMVYGVWIRNTNTASQAL